ncbi:MAG: hypothetical protein A2Y17_05540 [Clostridiales bacterium GWF2_38_85]|nr:MAG: hypothetical protein A2Y17_05540 [Clostridiales bacterium GWF2_38_85]HBL83311.1 hypothetical protein [Clostridiales bacterium]
MALSNENSANKYTAEIEKLNTKISAEEQEIKLLYTQIGELYFKNMSDAPNDFVAAQVGELKNRNAKIFEFKAEIVRIETSKKCEKCGAIMKDDATFCGECGYNPNTVKAEPALKHEGPICPKCGKKQLADVMFCGYCGTNLTVAKQPEPAAPAAPAQLICPKCGKVQKPGAVFCGECGTNLNSVKKSEPAAASVNKPLTCPKCGKVQTKDAVFCGECGMKIIRDSIPVPPKTEQIIQRCPKCKRVKKDGEVFCPECGTRV